MNLDNITEYIIDKGEELNVMQLKFCKPWCFRLYGVINSKLSMNRKSVYSRQQIFNELPLITQDILTTLKSIMIKYFIEYKIPEAYSSMDSLYDIFDFLGSLPNDTNEHIEQILMLCINLAFDYLSVLDLREEKILLLDTLIYMLYSSLVYLYRLMDMNYDCVDIKLIFNLSDK